MPCSGLARPGPARLPGIHACLDNRQIEVLGLRACFPWPGPGPARSTAPRAPAAIDAMPGREYEPDPPTRPTNDEERAHAYVALLCSKQPKPQVGSLPFGLAKLSAG